MLQADEYEQLQGKNLQNFFELKDNKRSIFTFWSTTMGLLS